MGQLAQLDQFECILIDTRRTETLFSRLGNRRAEAYIADRVEAMTDILAWIDVRYRAGDHDAITGAARKVSRMAADIGLTNLARVARDLAIVAQRNDPVALGAVRARMVRIGDRSLAQLWELPGLSL